jgi:hypothetical protein
VTAAVAAGPASVAPGRQDDTADDPRSLDRHEDQSRRTGPDGRRLVEIQDGQDDHAAVHRDQARSGEQNLDHGRFAEHPQPGTERDVRLRSATNGLGRWRVVEADEDAASQQRDQSAGHKGRAQAENGGGERRKAAASAPPSGRPAWRIPIASPRWDASNQDATDLLPPG